MTQPLDDKGLDQLLGEFHRDLLHQWTTTLSASKSRPVLEKWSDRLMTGIDLQDTDGLNTHRFLQVTISNLLTEVTAHLGSEGEMILDRASFHLSLLLTGLEQKTLTSDKAIALTAALASDEHHLRSMAEFDFAASTCARTCRSLDELRTSIRHLTEIVRKRFDKLHASNGHLQTKDT
ncbi:hypothetical protein ACWFMI_27230 [Nocardiopsis terrae]